MSARSFFAFLLLTLALVFTSCGAFAPIPAFKTANACASSTSTELAVKIKVELGNGEPIESALRRFKKEVSKSAHLMELRHRRYFENSQDKVKRKKKEAGMRRKFERMQRKRMQRV